MKKHTLSLVAFMVAMTTSAQCDWSKIGLSYSNECGNVVFELGSPDTCISRYTLYILNFRTKSWDTLHGRVCSTTLDTGDEYSFQANFVNKCCNNSKIVILKEGYIRCESAGIEDIQPPKPKISHILDLVGREVDVIEANKVYYIIYDNGKIEKQIMIE